MEQQKSKAPLYLLGGVLLSVYALTTPFITPAFRKIILPYVPATAQQQENVLRFAKDHLSAMTNKKKATNSIDLGSGDGRITLGIAKACPDTTSVGVELNIWLVLYSKWAALRSGQKNAVFHRQDIFTVNLSDYDVISVFGVPSLMDALEGKLQKELRGDAIVIACRFALPNMKPVYEDTRSEIWIYRK